MVKTGQLLTTTLAVLGCGLAATCQAQEPSPAGEVVTLPAAASGHSYSSGAFGDPGIGQAPHAQPPRPAQGPGPALGPGPSHGPGPGSGYGPDGRFEPPAEALEKSSWWEKMNPMRLGPGLIRPPREAFVRLEYLLWEIEEPGDVLLGAMPPAEAFDSPDSDFDEGFNPNALWDDNFDPSDGYLTETIVRDPDTGAPIIDPFTGEPVTRTNLHYVPRMTELQLRDNSGLRLTFGIPTKEYGTIELSGWMLEQASDERRYVPRELADTFEIFERTDDFFFIEPTFFPSTTANAETGSDFLTLSYDQLDVTYRSDMFGADAEYVVDALAPDGEGFKMKPLIGLKYVSLQESMYQRGQRELFFGGTTTSSLNSSTVNNFVGPTIGIRGELVHRWFTVGLQPSVSFTGNIAEASVSSERYASPTDPFLNANSSYFDFAPILELGAYVRINLSDHCRFNVGYDALWLSRAFRASRVIDYRVDNRGRQGFFSDIDTLNRTDHVAVEGLSLGLEYVF